jgi:hypothetical protein
MSIGVSVTTNLWLYHPKLVLARYGNASTRYLDRREQVKSDPVGKHQDKSDTSPGRACDRSKIDAVTIHIMELTRRSDEAKFDGINAHFAVLRNGTVLHLHDEGEYLFASHDFNCRSIAVEFEGNYPYKEKNGKYKWWSDTYEKPRAKQDGPTIDQIVAGRSLVKYFRDRHRIQNIFGHRQSCGKVCPGPHLWYNLVKWGVEELGLNDGGPGYTTSNDHCSGSVIPSHWRDDKWAVDLNPFSNSTFAGPTPSHGSVCVPP